MIRNKIIDAAVTVFSRNGFHSAGMDDIARAAGVAKGSLYYNFKDKSDLFATVICEGIGDLRRQIEEVLEHSKTIQDIMQGFIQANLHACAEYPELVDLIMREKVGGLSPEASARIQQAQEDYRQYIAALIDQGIREGILRQCDCQATAAACLMFLYAYFKTASRNSMPLAQMIEETSCLIMQGLSLT